MLKHIVRRLLSTIPILFGLSIILFAFVHLLPGDPARAILGEQASQKAVDELHQRLGLDDPLPQQYVNYLVRLLHGDLGSSIITNSPVAEDFATRFPATLELTVAALAVAIGVGIPLARIAAKHPYGMVDGGITVFSLLGMSIPVFVLGLTFQFLLGSKLHWLPTSGRLDYRLGIQTVTHFVVIDSILAGRWDAVVDALRHLILPAITLGSIPLALITRIARASLLDVMQEDYVRTARAKGLTPRRIDNRHIMRSAWLPVTTIIGLEVGSLLAGAILTETIFAWNGVGSWVYQAIQNRDYLVVQSSVLIFALIFVCVNLVVDIGYVYLDPRLRSG
jgi:peptide/nickel transport system permease protein